MNFKPSKKLSAFKIMDLGTLKYFLDLEVTHSKFVISLCQRKYFIDLPTPSRFVGSKSISNSSYSSIKLRNDNFDPYEDISSYRRLIVRLIYLDTTRFDITHITQQQSQLLSKFYIV